MAIDHKSAHHAIEQARENCWCYPWVIDVDVKGFFDNIDHELLVRAVRRFTYKKHILLYVNRWLKAPVQLKDGTQIQNMGRGTPQGGVISPLLANIFLHFVFDKWMEKSFSNNPFERYADDIIIHAKNEPEARHLLKSLRERFEYILKRLSWCIVTERGDANGKKPRKDNLIFLATHFVHAA